MKKYFLNTALLLIVTFNISKAQTACFDAVETRGCAPFSVTMIDCSGSSSRWYDYGEGGGDEPISTHTYNNPGLYTVRQLIPITGDTDDSIRVDYIEVLPKPFPVFSVGICEGRSVTVTINDMTYEEYSIDFGDGTAPVVATPPSSVNHIYANTSQRTITVEGKYNPGNCGEISTQNVIPINSLITPVISKVIVNTQDNSNGQATIQFSADATQRYYLQQSINNNTSYTTINTLSNLSGVQNIVVSNLNTSSNQYCYRLAAFDDCNPPIYSEEICSTTITAAALNNQNNIDWSAHFPGNVVTYSLFKNNSLIGTFLPGTTSYVDAAVNCGVNYCYQVVADLTNSLQSISDTMCVTAISTNTPTAIQNLNSTITGNNPSLTWDVPVGFSVMQYEILRSVNGGAFVNYATSTVNNFSENQVSIPGNTYCYIVNYTDACNNASASGPTTCPVILNVTIDNSSINVNYLDWSSYTGSWPSGVQGYRIERLDANNNVTATINVGLTFSFTDIVDNSNAQIIKYRIKAVANGPDTLTVSYSNIIEIKYEGAVFLPNAFTPDGDGTNDVFTAKGKFIKDFKMTVFNRWGEVVFSADQFDKGWDGAYMGTPASVDAYAWLIEATDYWGKNIVKRGSVTLLR